MTCALHCILNIADMRQHIEHACHMVLVNGARAATGGKWLCFQLRVYEVSTCEPTQ